MLMFLFCFLTIFGQHHRWRTLAISTKSLTCFMQHALGISCALASVPSSAMLLTSGERWKEEGRRTRKRRTTLQMWLSPPFSTFILVSILHQHYSSFFCAASNKGSSLSSLCSSCDISPSLLFFHHHIIIFNHPLATACCTRCTRAPKSPHMYGAPGEKLPPKTTLPKPKRWLP